MNVYTLLGAALSDRGFLRLLFENPLSAAKRLGVVLTNLELKTLQGILSSDDIEEQFEVLQAKMCPHPPCPLGLARLDDDDDVNLTSAAD